jgi:hypothetical protein
MKKLRWWQWCLIFASVKFFYEWINTGRIPFSNVVGRLFGTTR